MADLSLEDLGRVKVTTVSRQDSTVQQSAAAITVITPEMIRRSGATTIPELFRMVPGMDVARIDANKWAVSSRGFNDRFVGKQLVQIDGRTLYNPINAGVYWDSVDYTLEDIERIEVIRGPGASLWGANGVNGVINIITKSAKDTQGGLLTGGGGTEEQAFGGFRYGGKLGENSFFRVYGKGFTRDEGFSSDGSPNDGWHSTRGGFRMDWPALGPNALTLQGDFFRSVAGRRDTRPITNAPPFQFINIEDEVTTGGNVVGRWSRELSADSRWSLQAYWDRFERHSTQKLFAFDINTFDLDFQHQLLPLERWKLVYGAGYRLNKLGFAGSAADNGFAIGPPSTQRDTQIFSLFVNNEITLVPDRLVLTLGSRFEHNDFTGLEVQPTARLLWMPSRRQSVWFAVSRAVKTPSLLENDIQIGSLPAPGPVFNRFLPNQGLGSEELLSFELGYRFQPVDKLSFDTAVFYNDYRNLNTVVAGARYTNSTGTVIQPLTRFNRMTGDSQGGEIGATWQIADSWRLRGAYTLLKLHLHRGAGVAPGAEIIEGQSPQQQVFLQSLWNLSRTWEFDLSGRYVDGLPGFTPTVANYVSLDARLAWRARKNLEVEIVGQNLLENRHAEMGTSPLVRSPRVELQRGVYGKVTWRF
ncbi:TonB-dependent receptor [Verrucomicrobiota bacterium]|nr:TonB-dependent receptor [Verrucomicrobiota bacterium]